MRIRTVKPEFYRHEQLQQLEAEHPGAYVMLVFSGLWCAADRAGRFEWRPKMLKLDILPFLDFDLEATLQILEAALLIERYVVDGKCYGQIPSFLEHQRFSGSEAKADPRHPAKDEQNSKELPRKRSGTLERSKERNKGKEGDSSFSSFESDFEAVWLLYPKRTGGNSKPNAKAAYIARRKEGVSAEALAEGVRRYAAYCAVHCPDRKYIKQASTFFGPGAHYADEWWQSQTDIQHRQCSSEFDDAAVEQALANGPEWRRKLLGQA